MAVAIFAITQEWKELESCHFQQSKEEISEHLFHQYFIRRNHFKVNHFYTTSKKCTKTICC
jgi:hypothetical protein